MGLDRINRDAIAAEVIQKLVVHDEAATKQQIANWARCSKDEASHRLHNVLEPEGLVERAGKKQQPDPLHNANLWRITDEGEKFGKKHIEGIIERILNERPGQLVVNLLDRTESVENRMDTIRGEFESLKDDVEDLEEREVPGEFTERMDRIEDDVNEQSEQLDQMKTTLNKLAKEVDGLNERFDQVVGHEY